MTEQIWISVVTLAFSTLITVLIESRLIPYLSGRAAQPIYADGPSWHISKSGTPTMGGLAFLVAIGVSLSLGCVYLFLTSGLSASVIAVMISLLFSVGNSLIGIFDDLMKLKRKQNAGLTPMQKLILQFLLAVLFLMARAYFFDDTTTINLSFATFDIGLFYYPLAIILLLGIVNCANLSDGIDGLSSSVSLSIGAVFFIIGLIGSLTETSIIASALIGGAIGFLIFNRHPARIFMGDTGSLFLGALAASLAFTVNNPFIIIMIGGVYVIEGISVILQVIYYKLTKKRLFKMAPIHHHLEKCGYSENKICLLAIITTLVLSALSPLIFKV